MSPACLIWLFVAVSAATADGNVGCQFSKAVCQEDVERCFDDFAFGQCVGNYEDFDRYRYDLGREELRTLEREMERLFVLGYRWTHRYTQCVIQLILLSIREGTDYDEDVCSGVTDQDLNAALKALEGNEVQNPDPARVAHVKFTPSILDPRSDYADEVYSPIRDRDAEEIVQGYPESVIKVSDSPEFYNSDNRNTESRLRQLLLDKPKRSKGHYHQQMQQQSNWQQYPDVVNQKDPEMVSFAQYLATPSRQHYSEVPSSGDERFAEFESPGRSYNSQVPPSRHFSEKYNTPDSFRHGIESKDGSWNDAQLAELVAEELKTFNPDYNTPDSFRSGFEIKDLKDQVSYPRSDEVDDGEYRVPSGAFIGRQNVISTPEERKLLFETFRNSPEDRLSNDLADLANEEEGQIKQPMSGYTEGGTENLQGSDEAESMVAGLDGLDLLQNYAASDSGFKRLERLDVKKPGPFFNTNNYSFKNHKDDEKADASQPHEVKIATAENIPKVAKSAASSSSAAPVFDSESQVKQLKNVDKKATPYRKQANVSEDSNEVFISFKNPVNKWSEAATKLRKIAKGLTMDPNAFIRIKIEGDEVAFRVDPTRSEYSTADIARRIEETKDTLNKDYDLDVVSTRVRGASGNQPFVSHLDSDQQQLYLLSFLLCGVIAAATIGGLALFVIRRHAHTRDKLSGLAQPDSEASKDYQELCRARMAGKTAQDKPESVIGRISKENETNQTPSSRSSTSSWSEEPALTNMDISTGHMVLSYMEDHLKNKDRLEQEWVALCAYEAEPCSTAVAVKTENVKKNRYPNIVPYDHARVVLNELLNVAGSDYINASTITDHDPRNPAYIATQGPLPNTAPDLWQMVWEQGSVVMVMLTRLTENGSAMCHRYWPEEGSEVYHIYEVHLVSEHIWCDDYLVRSFYLKNLKTAETRTVTQFHFLSWPENGVPLSTKALLEFRRKVNKSYRGRSCPIVVHCSDGIGRTGTYCLIDMVLNRMAKGAKEIDIAATLEHIRDQRPLMVKTKQQFEFVLMAVAEEVHAILKALPATHSPPPVAKEKE